MSDLQTSIEPGVLPIGEDAWDALVLPVLEEASPFLRFGFLAALEEAGTLTKATGWIPHILSLRRRGTLVAAAPVYLKLNSHGEFVFDFALAELASRAGLDYYPKLLVAVPFTPATGRRFLTLPGEDRPALIAELGRALIALGSELGVSSIHMNFARADEISGLVELGFVERRGVQYHWARRGAERFEDYLARFNSKRRNQVKREVRALAEQGLVLERLGGGALEDPQLLETAFDLYRSTVDKFYYGRQYLNRLAFQRLAARFSDHLELVVAKDGGGQVLAGAINVAGPKTLYGRYWGAIEERPFLHFNVCYYRGIEECLGRGLDSFEPGAGGEHKLPRGFDPVLTASAHLFFDERLAAIAKRAFSEERARLEVAVAEYVP